MRQAARGTMLWRSAGIALLSALALLSGCASVQGDMAHERAGEADFSRLALLEAELPQLLLVPDAERLARDRSALAGLRSAAPLNASYRSRAAALSGQFDLLAGDARAAGQALSEAGSMQKNDASVFLLAARLESDQKRREAILRRGLASAADTTLLRAELAESLFAQGRFREAVAGFDEVLDLLPEGWKSYYSRDRGAALARLGAEGGSAELGDLVGASALSIADLALITQATTSLLDFLTAGSPWAPELLVERLKTGGFFGPDLADAAPQATHEPATRARAAYFLWKLLVAHRGDPLLATAYSSRYAARSDAGAAGSPAPSPVPDVPLDSWYFDAVLGCVERELLALPDGRSFLPDAPVSGAEFAAAVKKAAEED